MLTAATQESALSCCQQMAHYVVACGKNIFSFFEQVFYVLLSLVFVMAF
jgi:hypothetical protein